MAGRIILYRIDQDTGISPSWEDGEILAHIADPDQLVHDLDETMIAIRSPDGGTECLRFYTPGGATMFEMACAAANAWEEVRDDMDVRLTHMEWQPDGSWEVFWVRNRHIEQADRHI